MEHKKTSIWITAVIAGTAVAFLLYFSIRHWRPHWTTVQGAVIRRDQDPRKETPVAGTMVTASYGNVHVTAESDPSGYFRIIFPGTILPGQVVNFSFRHPDFKPLDLQVTIRFRSSVRQLLVVPLAPVVAPVEVKPSQPQTVISNLRVRYTVNTQSEENVGSTVQTFQVTNQPNVPCRHQNPCSPDGLWKATSKTVDLDAGPGNEFRDLRVSCIAGPCPFTRVEPGTVANGSRHATVSALDWSEAATFLVEAEVFHTSIASQVRESYPVIFGRSLNFTLPTSVEGVSFEAELAGTEMVFPLGPDLYLSWADCSSRLGSDGGTSSVYQCQLKPDFRF